MTEHTAQGAPSIEPEETQGRSELAKAWARWAGVQEALTSGIWRNARMPGGSQGP